MKTLRGKLEFISLWRPIKLHTAEGTIDLRDEIFPLLTLWNGRKALIDYTKKHIIVGLSETTDGVLEFEHVKEKEIISIIIKKPDGFTNLGAYIPNTLQFLNGQYIDVDLEEDYFQIIGAKQTLYGLYYTDGNSCKVPDEDVKNICQPGTTHSCIFLSVGANGFQCEKFDSYMARQILYRYDEGTMRATRIGDCELLGRKDDNG
jgi:hypothetical protein